MADLENRFLYDIDIAEVEDSESEIVTVSLTLYYRTYSITDGDIEITGTGQEDKVLDIEGAFKIQNRDNPV